MSISRSRFSELPRWALALGLLTVTARAQAQACCAGTGVVTPARLALHERMLVGAELKAGMMTGSYTRSSRYQGAARGTRELDFEQDLFTAARVLEDGQVALFVPWIETHRATRTLSETGGGLGDVNLSVRWDFTLAGASRLVPGIALLAGVTAPTGKPPDAPDLGVLATGATGTGAWQLSAGLALEQSFGPWLAGMSGFVAQRTARTVHFGPSTIHQRLAPQWTALAVLAYVLPSESAFALSASYTAEGNSKIDGAEIAGSGRRLTTLAFSAVWPLSEHWRLQGSLFDNPPLSELGKNQPADFGALATGVYAWR